MITAEKLQEAITTLEQFTDEDKYTLDMGRGSIHRDSSGRVFACLSGFYILAQCPGGWNEPKDGGAEQYCKPGGEEYSWTQGAEQLSHDLGFPYNENYEYADYTHLEKWASEDPELWGNHNGDLMFESATAYTDAGPLASDDIELRGSDDDGDRMFVSATARRGITLSDVLNHLRDVAERLARREYVICRCQ